MKLLYVILLALISTVIGASIVQIRFYQRCTGYLERAANANTVELAADALKTAIDYLELNSLKDGYTSIFWNTPDEDISFFYRNLKDAHSELNSLPTSATTLEKSNVLLKLRETLIGAGSEGDCLIYPDGLSRYPYNGYWFFTFWISFLSAIALVVKSHLIDDE